MRNPNISTMLKYYRKLNNLTVPEVSDYLKKQQLDAAVKTIYGWESGQTQPSADTLMSLCNLYGIADVLNTFGYSEEVPKLPLALSDDEEQLILAYRKNEEMQEAVRKLLGL